MSKKDVIRDLQLEVGRLQQENEDLRYLIRCAVQVIVSKGYSEPAFDNLIKEVAGVILDILEDA